MQRVFARQKPSWCTNLRAPSHPCQLSLLVSCYPLYIAGTCLTFIKFYFRQLPILHERKNPVLYVTMATKFYTMMPNILGSLMWTFVHVTLQARAIL